MSYDPAKRVVLTKLADGRSGRRKIAGKKGYILEQDFDLYYSTKIRMDAGWQDWFSKSQFERLDKKK